MFKTKQKCLILDVVKHSNEHPTAYEVYEICKKTIPKISLGTVYRNLNMLVLKGEIREIKTPAHITRYDYLDMNNSHNHFYCVKCNRLFDIFEEVKLPKNFENKIVMDYELTIKGICENCQKEGEM